MMRSSTNNFLTSGMMKSVDIDNMEVDGHMVDNSDQMSTLVDKEVAYNVLDHVTGQEMNMNTFVEQFLKPVLITLNLRWLGDTIAKLPPFCKNVDIFFIHRFQTETLEWPGDAVKEVRLVNRVNRNRNRVNQVHRLALFPLPDV